MAAWDFKIEFSGITIVHLSGAANAKTGVAYFSKGLSGRHTPCLLVPMDGLDDYDTLADAEAIRNYGLRTIPVPGGGYLLQVDLEKCDVDFSDGLVPSGPILYTNNKASSSAEPADWNDISYLADIGRLAAATGHKPGFGSKCTGTVKLPGGRLTSLPPYLAERARREYQVSLEMPDKTKKPLWKQRAADRFCLTVECTKPATRITVSKKGKKPLLMAFGPPTGYPGEMTITFSSNCAAGTGSADELREFGALLTPAKGFTPKMDSIGAITDDHPCITGFWID